MKQAIQAETKVTRADSENHLEIKEAGSIKQWQADENDQLGKKKKQDDRR